MRPRDELPPGPLRTRWLRARRAFGRTDTGHRLKRLLGREIRIPVLTEPEPSGLIAFPGEGDLPEQLRDRAIVERALAERRKPREPRPERPPPPTLGVTVDAGSESIKNVVLVSHCNFKGNSAFHVHAIAMELHQRGLAPVIAIPDEIQTVADFGLPPFPVVTYEEARTRPLRFPDGRGPDLVHAWTPRELVRRLTIDLARAHGCRYAVHLEDNEETVLSYEHGGVDIEALRELPGPILDRIVRPRQAHPLRMRRFLEQCAGMTVLTEALLEFVPPHVPATVIHAGFDESILNPHRTREAVRAELRVAPTDLVIVYPGNIHLVNMQEVRSLWEAVAQLRAAGRAIVLVKTGWGSTQIVDFPELGEGLRDLGWVPREIVPELLAAADVLVQPGGPGPFNDYRFPSKLPEFLASGRATVLPRTNIGLKLRGGVEALLLERGDAAEIEAVLCRLLDDPVSRERIGEAGRRFALRELRWSTSADRIITLYGEIATGQHRASPAPVIDEMDPPVKLVARVPTPPTPSEAEAARSNGIYGFCVASEQHPAAKRRCIRSEAFELGFDGPLADSLLVHVDGMPLALSEADTAAIENLQATGTALFDSSRRDALAGDVPTYSTMLRKLVLWRLLLSGVEEPIVVIDARRVWSPPSRRADWLRATRAGLIDGVRQYYASRGLLISDADSVRAMEVT